VNDIWANRDREYNIRCLTKRLQRIDKEMHGDARADFAAFIPDGDLAAYAKNLGAALHRDFVSTMGLLRNADFQRLLLEFKRKPRVFYVAHTTQDEVSSEWLVRDPNRGEKVDDLPPMKAIAIPEARQLRDAREQFADLLSRENTKEAIWQSFFAQHPYVLSVSLPLKLMPQDFVRCLAKTPSGCQMSLMRERGSSLESDLQLGRSRSVAEEHNKDAAMPCVRGRQARFSPWLSWILFRMDRSADSGGQLVAMMQATKPWHRNNPATDSGLGLCFTTGWRSLIQSKMRSVVVVVADVPIHQAFEMAFIQNDHMVEQVAAAVADPALCHAVLPRTAETGSLRLDAEALHCLDHIAVEVRAAIKNQIVGRGVKRERLAQLLNYPSAGRVSCHIAMQDSPPVMRNNEEAIKHTESERRHGEEIHRCDSLAMIAQKRRPSICRLGIPRRFSHPAQHCSLRNIEAEHLQLTVNARRTPGRVFADHAEDQLAQFQPDALSSYTSSTPGEPRPIHLETYPMPAHNSFRSDENQRLLPSRPEPPQYHPEQFVRRSKPRLRLLPFQSRELLSKGQVLQQQTAARAKESGKQNRQEPKQAQHESVVAERYTYPQHCPQGSDALGAPAIGATALLLGWQEISRARTWRKVREKFEKLRADEIQHAHDIQAESAKPESVQLRSKQSACAGGCRWALLRGGDAVRRSVGA
jgi:hypothetical protein